MITLRERDVHAPEHVESCASCESQDFTYLGVQWMKTIYWQKHTASETPEVFLSRTERGALQWGANMFNCNKCGTTIIDLP